MSESSCYHCGLPIPDGVDLSVKIAAAPRAMCCYGCQAVAQSIVDNGLEEYYRSRDSLPESPREAMPAILEQLALFDHAEFQKSFVKELGENEREASLLLEGITCSACIWLNEQHVGRLPGVTAVDINYTTRRARVRWNESRVKLSDILGAIAAIGYRAYPYDAAKNEEISRKERRDALWRLWVAGFGMMQVMMYAYPVYIANFSQRHARPAAAAHQHGPAGGDCLADHLCRQHRGDLRAAGDFRTRGVLRLADDVRVFPARWALSRNDGAAKGVERDRGAGQADADLCPKNAEFSG